jgi:hypothetical protein
LSSNLCSQLKILSLIRVVGITVFALTFGFGLCFGADDLNLDDVSLDPKNNFYDVSVDDYRSIINSYDLKLDDAELEALLAELDSQLSNEDYEEASRTKEDIRKYLEENPEAAPAGLDELINNSIINVAEGEDVVEVDLESLSEQIRLEEDFGSESPDQAENMQALAQMLWDKNPDLARDLMDMSNLINLGRDEDARQLYREIDKDLLTALLELDPELVSRAFEYLEGGVVEPEKEYGDNRNPPPNSSQEIFPSINNIGSPLAAAPIPAASLPSINIMNPSILLSLIMVPLLILPLFLFRNRVQTYFPKPRRSMFRERDRSVLNREPINPKERVLYHFIRLIQIMKLRGITKHDSETHREYSLRFKGKKEEINVKEVSRIYETAKFTKTRIDNEDADKCAEIVDTIENQSNIDSAYHHPKKI